MLSHKGLLAGLLVMVVAAGCSSASQYLDSGNRYFAQKKYQEAKIEYANAVKKDPMLGMAHLRLADTAAQLGDGQTALREYIRAGDLLPADNEAVLKAASAMYLAGRYDEASSRAGTVLARDPKNLEALLLKTNALARMNKLDDAIRQAEEAIKLDPKVVARYASLGNFEVAKGDTVAAEKAFRLAVEVDPKSVYAHTALANFLFSAGRTADAEAALKQAYQLDPKKPETSQVLASFYIALGRARAPEAEPYLKSIADGSAEPGPKLRLADYYLLMDRADEAVAILNKVAADKTKKGFAEAKTRLAGIQYRQDKKADAQRTVDDVLKQAPKNVPALLIKAQCLLDDKKIDEALTRAKDAAAAAPTSVEAQYMLGRVYSAKDSVDEAIKAFTEVARLNPRAAAAQIQLARLQMLKGFPASAVQFAQQAAAMAPDDPDAKLMLARMLMLQENQDGLARAETALKELQTQYPQSAPVVTSVGMLQLRKNDAAGARKSFEKAASLDPTSLEPLTGLVTLDIAANKLPDARGRVEARLARTPSDPKVLILAARTYGAGKDNDKAEQMLLKALEVAPDNMQAYELLGKLYFLDKKLGQAREKFAEMARKQTKPVAAETMIGIILQAEGKSAEAQKQYEKVMTLDASASVAANNLAWMYAEAGTNLDMAVQLAQTAKAGLPDSPQVDDTLGWVYYRKKLPDLALGPLLRAVEKEPKNAAYQYHLGMTYAAKTGENAKAKEHLQKALALDPSFDGAADAKKTLASLK
jgi:putative PEP-CTERM system TPR-repeat lipoprotein